MALDLTVDYVPPLEQVSWPHALWCHLLSACYCCNTWARMSSPQTSLWNKSSYVKIESRL